MKREEVTKHLNILLANRCWDCRYERAENKVCDEKCVFKQAVNEAIEALQDKEGESQFYTEDDYWNGMFTESEEAYKALTGEEMGKDIKAKQKKSVRLLTE